MSDEQFQLAAGWEWATFEDVATVASDLVDPTLTPDAAHIAPNHIESWTGALLPYGTIRDDGMTSAKHRFRRGQILYSKIRPYLAKAAMAEFDGLCSADMYPIDANIDARFLLRWMLTPSFTNEASLSQGRTVLPKINQDGLSRLHVPVAPLNEQRRIVEKLDAVFEKSRAAKARLERLPALLEKLKRSILAAAFRGDLTSDWRAAHPDVEPASVLLERIRAEHRRRWEEGLRAKGKDPRKATYDEPAPIDTSDLPELPTGWAWASVDELASLFQYGTSAKTDDASDVPVLRMGNILDGDLVLENLKFLPASHDEFPELFLKTGDILFNRTNSPELVGKTAVYRGQPQTCSFASYLIRVRVEVIEPEWVSYFINSPAGRDWVRSVVAQQVGQANVNGTKLRALAVPVPPSGEIQAALATVTASFDVVRALRARIGKALGQAVRVEQASSAKAFRGELVPQDPTDEPASVLLDRIRAARPAGPQRARRGRAARAPDANAAKPIAARPKNGHDSEAAEGGPVDLVVAAFQQAQRLTAGAIGESTGLDAASVKKALRVLVEGGHVRVEGRARGTNYVWRG